MTSFSEPRYRIAVLAALVLGASSACHQAPAAADPVQVAQRFLEAVEHRQWDSAAALVDSAETLRFRDGQLMMLAQFAEHEREILHAVSATGSGGLGSMGSSDKLDTALVGRHRTWRVRALPDSPTLDEMARLSPRRFYARMYEAPVNCWTLPSRSSPRSIGAVVDHDSVAYVVYEAKATGLNADTEERVTAVLTAHRGRDGWRVRQRALAPHVDVIALLDTSTASREMMARACAAP